MVGAACGKARQRAARFWLAHRARKQRSALRKLEAGSVPKVQGTVPGVSTTSGSVPSGHDHRAGGGEVLDDNSKENENCKIYTTRDKQK